MYLYSDKESYIIKCFLKIKTLRVGPAVYRKTGDNLPKHKSSINSRFSDAASEFSV